ncbi:hypothetical protein L6452_25704 [Arctium lappa]|uniref:Uncharacterized protein n=1 Tax=Arctium lappa TaxID=4217 RepID=A0ACB9AAR5_ARCLA|nr:hypothetical protein L6452_25704 [Arctium lappa]
MSYYSRSKAELSKIGTEAFALLDDFSCGYKSKPKPSSSIPSAPCNQIPEKLFHYQYQHEQAYVVRQQVYVSPLPVTRIGRVISSHDATKKYGGSAIVEYPKRKTSRKGLFYG